MATYDEYKRMVVQWTFETEDVRQTYWDFGTSAADPEGAAETAYDTLWTNLKVYSPGWVRLSSYRWYGNDETPDFREPGVPFRITSRSVAGTGTGNNLPPQLAVVVTKRLAAAYHKHHGRSYFPISVASTLEADGRVANAVVDAIALRHKNFLNDCVTAGLQPIVCGVVGLSLASILGASATTRWAYDVEDLRVDDTFDTQRRRGYDSFAYEKVEDVNHV